MRILKLLLILLLLIFPLGELLRLNPGNNIYIKPLDIVTGLITLTWTFLILTKRIKKPKLHKAILVFPGVALVALAINSYWLAPQEIVVSSLYLIRWISYLGVFFAVLTVDKDFIKKLQTLLLIDGLLIVLIGYVQFSFFSDLAPLYYLGWDDHLYRLFSVFLDPNFTGAILVLYLLFVAGLLTSVTAEKSTKKINLSSNFFKLSKRQLQVVLSIIVLLTLLAIFLTFSRSSLLMLIVSAIVFFVLIGKKKLIFGLFGVILLFVIVMSPKFYVENYNLFRVASSGSRISNYQEALYVIQKDPIIGVGFNAYRYAKDKYDIHHAWIDTPSHADAGVDNSFLFVAATTGFIGLAAYLYLWAHLIKRAYVRYKRDKNIFAILFLASSCGLFVHAMFINSLFFPAIMVWMWLMFGIMEHTSQ